MLYNRPRLVLRKASANEQGGQTNEPIPRMKKILLILSGIAALASNASADYTLDDALTLSDNATQFPSDWTANGATVTLVFDVKELNSYFQQAQPQPSQSNPVLAVFRLSGGSTAGLAVTSDKGFVASWNIEPGNAYNNRYSFNGANYSSINWDTVTDAAFTYSYYDGIVGCLTVKTKDPNTGTISSYSAYGTNGGVKSTGNDASSFQYLPSVITAAYAWDGKLTDQDAIIGLNTAAIEKSHTVPEPGAATLGLFALAGLAARRRRQ